jgi:hypothetical protein
MAVSRSTTALLAAALLSCLAFGAQAAKLYK